MAEFTHFTFPVHANVNVIQTAALPNQGGELWEQFRQYEETLLQTIKEQLDQEDCPEREFVQDLYNKQRSRVDALFQRQLAVPLTGEVLICSYKHKIL